MASKSKTALWGSFSIFSGSLGRQILQTVVMLILARILTPDDFGAVAIVISAISIFQVFAELGVSVALVQKKEITDLDKDSGFSLTLLFTAVNVLLIWVLAGWAARFFEAPVLAGLFKVAALSYLFRGLFSLFRSLLLRSLKFKILAGLEFVAALMAGVLDVVLAALGYGAYAIVWGRVLEAFLLLVAAAVVVRYIPRSLGSVANMVALFRFGIWVSLYRLVLLGSNQFDKFIIGKVMPMANLGGFYLAQRITYLVPELILGAVDQVMLPIYSRMQDDRPGMVEGYWKGLQYSLMLVFPFSALLIVLSTPIVTVFLGDKWTGADRIIQVLSIYAISLGMGRWGPGQHVLRHREAQVSVHLFPFPAHHPAPGNHHRQQVGHRRCGLGYRGFRCGSPRLRAVHHGPRVPVEDQAMAANRCTSIACCCCCWRAGLRRSAPFYG
jgi:O-antigen/teichoic acid export membrane protein